MGHINFSEQGRTRMQNRLQEQPEPATPAYDPSFLADPPEKAPAETAITPAVMSDPAPADTDVTPAEQTASAPGKATKKCGAKSSANRQKAAPGEDEADADKDKYSIYLPKKLSMALRMVYIITRKKYSHITETALTDMLFNRYQCHNPKCHVRFSMSETDVIPERCPRCGGRDITPLRLDILE